MRISGRTLSALETFSTARLLAERLQPAHRADLQRMDQDEQFMAYLGGVRDEAATGRYLDWNLAHWSEHGFGLWMLREKGTEVMIGRAVLRHLDVEGVDEVETGYGFLPGFCGRGLATEIARACLDIGHDRLGLASIVAITLPTNTASQRVLRKAGLEYEREFVHDSQLNLLFRSRYR